jgi:hypothetical protein
MSSMPRFVVSYPGDILVAGSAQLARSLVAGVDILALEPVRDGAGANE